MQRCLFVVLRAGTILSKAFNDSIDEFIEDDDISALLPAEEVSVKVFERGTDTVIENGKITCEITRTGKLRFLNQDGKLLLEDLPNIEPWLGNVFYDY